MNKHRKALRLIAIIGLVAGTVLSFVGAIGYGSLEGATGDLDPLAMDAFGGLAAIGTSLFAISVIALLFWLLAGSLATDLGDPASRGLDLRAPDLRAAELRAPELRAPDLRAPDLRVPDQRVPDARAADLGAPDLRAADGGAAY
jgi:hypothetical protein